MTTPQSTDDRRIVIVEAVVRGKRTELRMSAAEARRRGAVVLRDAKVPHEAPVPIDLKGDDDTDAPKASAKRRPRPAGDKAREPAADK